MKKYLLGLTAMAFIAGTSAFTEITTEAAKPSKLAELHWYVRSGTGNYTAFTGNDISVLCPNSSGEICALGFEDQPSGTVTDASESSADAVRKYAE